MGAKPRARARSTRAVAFLRGMNLGRRRISNFELCRAFEAIGFSGVEAFLASGNVVFDAPSESGDLEALIAGGLRRQLQYDVPTFVRSADDISDIAGHQPFADDVLRETAGRVQVMLLTAEPPPADARAAIGQATEDDRLSYRGREIYWLPKAGLSDSDLDIKAIERAVGGITIRTKRTINRLAAKYF